MLVVALLALGLWLEEPKTIVELLLMYYNGITQFAPGIIAAFVWPRANVWGVAAGLVVGLAIAVVSCRRAPIAWGVNLGFVALVATSRAWSRSRC